MRIDRLRELREKMGLSQQDVADRSGVSLTQIWRYENGKSDPTLDAIAEIAKVLNCSVDYLAGLTGEINGQITERDLTAMERRLLNAYRNSKGPNEKLRNLLLAITSDEELMAEQEE